MPTFKYPNGGRSLGFSILILLAVAITAYVAVALVRNTTWSGAASAAFVAPVHAAESNTVNPLPGIGTARPAIRDSSRSLDELISQPRECDVARGISAECIFMD
jgi:hypothetical protein